MTGIPEAQPSTGQGTHVSTTGQANCGIPAVFSLQGHSLLYHFSYCILAPLERALLFVLGLCLDLLSLATTHSSSQLATYLVAVAGCRQAQGTGWR